MYVYFLLNRISCIVLETLVFFTSVMKFAMTSQLTPSAIQWLLKFMQLYELSLFPLLTAPGETDSNRQVLDVLVLISSVNESM